MSRQPEVMEWYYKRQETIASTLTESSSEVAFTWLFSESLLVPDDNLQSAVVYVSVSRM